MAAENICRNQAQWDFETVIKIIPKMNKSNFGLSFFVKINKNTGSKEVVNTGSRSFMKYLRGKMSTIKINLQLFIISIGFYCILT
jgi:hypothetical protein